MKVYLLLFVALVVVASGAAVAHANHSWGNYHWARTANPFTLKLGDNVSGAWDGHLRLASNDWATSTVLDTVVVAGNTNATKGKNTPKNCTPTAGRVEVCNAKYGATGWLGIASIWASGEHITQGTAKMNDTYFSAGSYNTPEWRQMVMCQEVAHTFGLAHQDENFNNANLGSCMDYTSSPASNQHPNAHDFAQLELMYGSHTDTTNTVALSTPAEAARQNEVDHSDMRTWGKEVSASTDKRHSIFERDFGHGQKVFTFVTWAQ